MELHTQLATRTLKELRIRAQELVEASWCDAESLEEARDAEQPKDAIIRLILNAEAAKLEAERSAAAQVAADEKFKQECIKSREKIDRLRAEHMAALQQHAIQWGSSESPEDARQSVAGPATMKLMLERPPPSEFLAPLQGIIVDALKAANRKRPDNASSFLAQAIEGHVVSQGIDSMDHSNGSGLPDFSMDFLSCRVVPALLPALIEANRQRPEDPAQFVREFLAQNQETSNPRK